MNLYSDWDEDDGCYDPPDSHEMLNLAEPFRTLLRTKQTRRYDIRNNVANRLGMPRGREMSPPTERFLDELVGAICLAWETRNASANYDRARGFVKDALYYLSVDDEIYVMEDFGWGEEPLRTTLSTYQDDFHRFAIRRLSKRVERLLDKAHRAHRRHAA